MENLMWGVEKGTRFWFAVEPDRKREKIPCVFVEKDDVKSHENPV